MQERWDGEGKVQGLSNTVLSLSFSTRDTRYFSTEKYAKVQGNPSWDRHLLGRRVKTRSACKNARDTRRFDGWRELSLVCF